MRFFKDCKTIEEVKARYKTLAKAHHPDCGETPRPCRR